MRYNKVKLNYDKKAKRAIYKYVQRMTIGFCKKLHLEIIQNADFCKFSRKIKGAKYLCLRSKIMKKCDILL